MLQEERRNKILRFITEKQSTNVDTIVNAIYASPATVRRDLKYLETIGCINLSYGHVSLRKSDQIVLPLLVRESTNALVKKRIAKAAFGLIREHDRIFIDHSTTAAQMIEYMKPEMDLTVFTISVDTAAALSRKGIRTYCAGGMYDASTSVMSGYIAANDLEKFNADLAIFSSFSLILSTGDILDVSTEHIRLREIMMRRSHRHIFLCDSSKYDKEAPFVLCSLKDIDDVICNKAFDTPFPVNQIVV